MLRTQRRVSRRICLAVVSLHLAACTSTAYVPLSTSGAPQTLVGVVKKSGERITFGATSVSVGADTIYALSGTDSLRIPTDSVRSIIVQSPSSGKTVGLIAGLTLGAIAIAVLAAMSNGL